MKDYRIKFNQGKNVAILQFHCDYDAKQYAAGSACTVLTDKTVTLTNVDSGKSWIITVSMQEVSA